MFTLNIFGSLILTFVTSGVSGQSVTVLSQICKYDQVSYEFIEPHQYYLFANRMLPYDKAEKYCENKFGIIAIEDDNTFWEYVKEKLRDHKEDTVVWVRKKDSGNQGICASKINDERAEKCEEAVVFCQCKAATELSVIKNSPNKTVVAQKRISSDNDQGDSVTDDPQNTAPLSKKARVANKPGESEEDEDKSGLSKPISALIAILGVACVVGAIYGVARHQKWNPVEAISSRLPYNRNREERLSVNGNYSPGQELVEMASHQRPIHVYEEIIPRGQLNMMSPSNDNTCTIHSLASTPGNSPPPPPLNTSYGKDMNDMLEPHYLSPNRRGDFVPGDVRSPLPTAQVFKYPMNTKSGRMKEIHYASVETVQTDTEDTYGQNKIDIDVDEYKPFEGTSSPAAAVPNRYSMPPERSRDQHAHVTTDHPSPVIENGVVRNDYENGRFLRTVMKADIAPHSPSINHQINNEATYENQQEPTYATIEKKNKKKKWIVKSNDEEDVTYATPKRSTSLRRNISTPTLSNDQGRHKNNPTLQTSCDNLAYSLEAGIDNHAIYDSNENAQC